MQKVCAAMCKQCLLNTLCLTPTLEREAEKDDKLQDEAWNCLKLKI